MNSHPHYLHKHRADVKHKYAQVTLCYANRFPGSDEILSMPGNDLEKRIAHWMWDSRNDDLPRKKQIIHVIHLISQRPDAETLSDLVTECRYYIDTLTTWVTHSI